MVSIFITLANSRREILVVAQTTHYVHQGHRLSVGPQSLNRKTDIYKLYSQDLNNEIVKRLLQVRQERAR